MTSPEEELVRRHFDIMWNERNFTACDELMATDFVENAPAAFASKPPGRVNGPAAMRGTMLWLLEQFPNIHFTIESLVHQRDIVVARVRVTGTGTGTVNGQLPATALPFDYLASHWFRVTDGRLAEHWATRDDLTLMIQLGVVTAPPA